MELGIPALATTGIGGGVRAAARLRLLEFLGVPDLHGRAIYHAIRVGWQCKIHVDQRDGAMALGILPRQVACLRIGPPSSPRCLDALIPMGEFGRFESTRQSMGSP
jgi:hypothetical protein